MACIQCKKNTNKYKCPTCLEPYLLQNLFHRGRNPCSVACYKEHKQNPCESPPSSVQCSNSPLQPQLDYEYPTEDTVSIEKLKLLERSQEVKKCLENPHVRTILELLDKSPHPDNLIQEYMQEPIFTEVVDACLSVVQHAEDQC